MIMFNAHALSCSTQIRVLKKGPAMFWTKVYLCPEIKSSFPVLNKCLSVFRKQVSIGVQKSIYRCPEQVSVGVWIGVLKKVFICVLKKCLSVFRRSVYQCSEKERIGVLKTCLSGFWKIVYLCSEKVSIGVNETCEKCENAKNAKMRKMRNM